MKLNPRYGWLLDTNNAVGHKENSLPHWLRQECYPPGYTYTPWWAVAEEQFSKLGRFLSLPLYNTISVLLVSV